MLLYYLTCFRSYLIKMAIRYVCAFYFLAVFFVYFKYNFIMFICTIRIKINIFRNLEWFYKVCSRLIFLI